MSELGSTSVAKALESKNDGPVHIRFESASIHSIDHMNRIAAAPANAGRTFQVMG